ncbi:MAG: hypothetical protein WAT71_18080 [Ignavibacteria bacterium]
MGEYKRSTREANISNLNPNAAEFLKSHSEKYELGNVENSVLYCCETTSVKEIKKLFKTQTETTVCSIILTPQFLIWATFINDETPVVMSARIKDIQIQDYEKSEFYKLIQDSGINVKGIYTDIANPGNTFIGLGSEQAAVNFRNKLKEIAAEMD